MILRPTACRKTHREQMQSFRYTWFHHIERCSITLRFDDDIRAEEMPDVCECQEESGEFEVCREGKVGEVESLNLHAKTLAAYEARPVQDCGGRM